MQRKGHVVRKRRRKEEEEEEDMEEVVMMMISSPDSPTTNETNISQEPITNATCPSSWKLYENPFYNSPHQYQYHHHHHHHHDQQGQVLEQHQCQSNKQHIHQLHLPLSTRKIAASFWDLTFFRPVMETELDIARAQIIELKAELDYERKARKRAESVNKRLAKELAEERREREAMERLCEELAREVSSDKEEMDRIKREMEEERKMMRMAEILREERVQMKLTEAKIFFQEKLLELEETRRTSHVDTTATTNSRMEQKNQEDKIPGLLTTTSSNASRSLSGKFARLVLSEKSVNDDNNIVDSQEKFSCNDHNVGNFSSMAIQRRAPSEPENPHIKRGIKGFVEFPRVVRAIGSRSRQWGTKLECQRAQLRILLKHRSPIGSSNLIMS